MGDLSFNNMFIDPEVSYNNLGFEDLDLDLENLKLDDGLFSVGRVTG